MKKFLPALAAALMLAGTTAGCGGNAGGSSNGGHDLSGAEQQTANRMSRYLAQHGNGSISKKDASCIADSWVGRSGVAKLKKSKVLTASGQVNTQNGTKITPGLASDYADALLGCIDYAKLQSRAVAKVNPKVDAKKMAGCFSKAMPKSDEKMLLVSTMTGKTDRKLMTKNAQAVQTCQAKAQK
jgi:hypothetical protein